MHPKAIAKFIVSTPKTILADACEPLKIRKITTNLFGVWRECVKNEASILLFVSFGDCYEPAFPKWRVV